MARLQDEYKSRIVGALVKRFEYKNVNQAPRLLKVVINVGAGEAVADPKVLEIIAADLGAITGQKAATTRVKRAISAFKIRAGMPIGVKVTLRGARMFEFIDRFFNFASPRIRDFEGFSPDSFDAHGNYTLGLNEQVIFPEMEASKIKKAFGMDITFNTSARRADEARALLEELGMPFRKEK